MVGQGIAYAGFAAVIWPSIPLVIPAKLIGLGYGVTTSIQNAGLAAFPLIIAAIYSASDDTYIPNVEYFFVLLAAIGVVIGLYLNYYDYQHESLFNSPAKANEVHADTALHRTRSTSFTAVERQHRALSSDGMSTAIVRSGS
jgi:MFS family permease